MRIREKVRYKLQVKNRSRLIQLGKSNVEHNGKKEKREKKNTNEDQKIEK